MTFDMIMRTVFEIMLFAAVIWGVFNEDKLAAFERRFIAKIKRKRFKVIKGNADIKLRTDYNNF